MSLRAILLRSRIQAANAQLEQLRTAAQAFEARRAELETAIHEAETRTDLTDEDRQALETEVENFDNEVNNNAQASENLQNSINEMEAELQKIEAANEPRPAQPAAQQTEPGATNTDTATGEERTRNFMTAKRYRNMSFEQRAAFVKRDEVKGWLEQIRTCIRERRALENAGLTIPEVALPMLRQEITVTSKLYAYFNNQNVRGTTRQVVMGDIPEAVWTEVCGELNELSLGFNETEVDAYECAGFFEVCNATLQDSDEDLAGIVLEALGKAIGKAYDKAGVYGTGVKMPTGFVTRLAQTAKPAGYPTAAEPWEDLHTSNIITITGKTGLALFKEIVEKTGCADNDYFSDEMVYICNRKTHRKLVAESMDKNANAAIVAAVNDTMPVLGGGIVELPFMADGDVAFGYLGAYLMAEREGISVGQSEHVRFLKNRTVFRGIARYDGKPVIAKAFGILNIDGKAPTTSVTFPADEANEGE